MLLKVKQNCNISTFNKAKSDNGFAFLFYLYQMTNRLTEYIKKYYLLFALFFVHSISAQFLFSGKVNPSFKQAKVYLFEVKDLKKRHQIIPENMLFQTDVNKDYFVLKGNFLAKNRRFYSVLIDNCTEGILNAKHLLNQCTDNRTILFIANNKDTISFPLNDLNQMFCSIDDTNNFVQKIDSLQESVLANLPISKNDRQKKIIYKNYFNELKQFSKSLNEPLAELYAYCLYADENSFSRTFYLRDLKKSSYYKNLGQRLIHYYPTSFYGEKLQQTIDKDSFYKTENKIKKKWYYLLGFLLLFSISLNVYLYYNGKPKPIKISEVLSIQEQKIFHLIQKKKSNQQIANELFISLSTVKTHINTIYKKLRIASRKDIFKLKSD